MKSATNLMSLAVMAMMFPQKISNGDIRFMGRTINGDPFETALKECKTARMLIILMSIIMMLTKISLKEPPLLFFTQIFLSNL